MNKNTLIIVIVCGIVCFFVLSIVIIHLLNKRRNKSLENKLKEFKIEEKKSTEGQKVIISKEQTSQTIENLNELQEKEQQDKDVNISRPIIEDYIDSQEYVYPQNNNTNNKLKKNNIKKSNTKPNSIKKDNNELRDKEFEDFLNEHDYSRKIINHDILEKLKDLPPEIKAIILSNVLNKYDD